MGARLLLKTPDDEADVVWLAEQLETYANCAAWMAMFIEKRANCGDMTTREVLDEFEKSVCQCMRAGFDILGEQ